MVNFLINKGSRYIITFSVHAAFALKIPIPCKKLSDIFKSKQFTSLIHFLKYKYICEIISTSNDWIALKIKACIKIPKDDPYKAILIE